MNRRVIKSEHASIFCPEIDLEIPPKTQKGKLSTVEGFIFTTKEHFDTALSEGIYDEMGDDFIEKIKSFVNKLNNVLELKSFPFTFIIDDPAGNSFIENPFAPNTDPYAKIKFYDRTIEMCQEMGYGYNMNEENENENKNQENENENQENVELKQEIEEPKINIPETKKEKSNVPMYYNNQKKFEVYKSESKISSHLMDFTKSIETNQIFEEALTFQTDCTMCGVMGEVYSCVCSIPYFKEIIITSFKCQKCGFKTVDVTGGGGISEKGTKITLKVTNPDDLNRDVFKSETACIKIPELEFETDTGSLGSMFTTVEGVLDKIETNIKNMPFSQGDSNDINHLDIFCEKIRNMMKLEKPFTLIIDDCLSNSFIFPSKSSDDNDANLLKEEYERTWEQNEELGINDMKVENYETN